MVSASQFYKMLNSNGYKTLLDKKIVPTDDKFQIIKLGEKNEYKTNYIGNSTEYGKFIELLLIKHLRGQDTNNEIKKYLPNCSNEKFIKIFSSSKDNILKTPTDKNNLYDLIYGNSIIDIKTYKREKFSKQDLRSFMLQMIVYYINLESDIKKTIKYVTVYNPISNELIQTNVSNYQSTKIKKIYDSMNNFLENYYYKNFSIFSFFGIYKNIGEITRLKNEVKKYKTKFEKIKKSLSNVNKLLNI